MGLGLGAQSGNNVLLDAACAGDLMGDLMEADANCVRDEGMPLQPKIELISPISCQ